MPTCTNTAFPLWGIALVKGVDLHGRQQKLKKQPKGANSYDEALKYVTNWHDLKARGMRLRGTRFNWTSGKPTLTIVSNGGREHSLAPSPGSKVSFSSSAFQSASRGNERDGSRLRSIVLSLPQLPPKPAHLGDSYSGNVATAPCI